MVVQTVVLARAQPCPWQRLQRAYSAFLPHCGHNHVPLVACSRREVLGWYGWLHAALSACPE